MRNRLNITSEIKATAHSYSTHRFVSFDVDAEELQIARIYGESYIGISGSTPFGAAILCGDKAKGTDFHSITAKQAGTGRDASKQCNYLGLYGGGVKAAVQTIKVWHADYDLAKAEDKARKQLLALKGKKSGKTGLYYGGIASHAFNKMHELASAPELKTPILGTKASKAIWAKNNGRGVTPGMANFTIQAAASSFGFLSCLLVSSYYLLNKYGINTRFCASMHDEVIWHMPKQDAEKAAYLMQVAHAWCWALMHYKCGVYDLPLNCAFASAMNIDKTWRKSAKASVATPTFEAIKPGREYTMAELNNIAKQNNYWGMQNV